MCMLYFLGGQTIRFLMGEGDTHIFGVRCILCVCCSICGTGHQFRDCGGTHIFLAFECFCVCYVYVVLFGGSDHFILKGGEHDFLGVRYPPPPPPPPLITFRSFLIQGLN